MHADQLADERQGEKNEVIVRKHQAWADSIIDAPIIDEHGHTIRVDVSEHEFNEQHGIYELPVPTEGDFEAAREEAATSRYPTPPSALQAWEMMKAKDLEGFDTVCLRHKKWGTEVELLLGSVGSFKVRPSPLHQVTTVEVDGSSWVAKPGYDSLDAPHVFDYMWQRHNLSDEASNAWRCSPRTR